MAHLGGWLLEGELSEEISLFEHMGGDNIIAFFPHFPFVPFIILV